MDVLFTGALKVSYLRGTIAGWFYLELRYRFSITFTNDPGRRMLSTFIAALNRGAMSSSLKPAMPQPMRVTRKVSSKCCIA